MIRQSKELQIGKAGEYIVCADLILKGFVAFPSEQGLPYDVLLDTGKRLVKVQVKTCSGVRIVPQRHKETKCYVFNIKRHGKNNSQRYHADEIDIFALVCLDTMKVGYLKNGDMPTTINIRADELRGTYYDEEGLIDYARVQELKKEGLNCRQIAKKLNKHESTVNRYMKDSHVPFVTKARYFADFERRKEWIAQL